MRSILLLTGAFVSRVRWGLALGLVAALLSAAEPTRVYLANDDHTDYMWTADADTYAKVFVEMLDWHLKLADETAGNPPPYRNRFNTDGSLWLETSQQRKNPAEFARLIERIKDGTISVPRNTLVSLASTMARQQIATFRLQAK